MSMSFRARTWIVLASSATLTVSSATIAAAADEPPPPPESTPEEAPPEWPPADTDGEWLPVPEDLFPPSPVPACGSTVTISTGDVFEVEYQAQEQADGTIRIDYRGDQTTDLVRESDGATVDELDIGGPWTEIISADGLTVTFSVDGASIYAAYDEVEAEVFAASGLPDLFYFETGNLTERVYFPDDPAATTIVSAEILTDTAHDVQDLCDLLDDAAEGSDDGSGAGGDGDS